MSRKNLVKRFGLELFFVALLALFYFFYQFSLSENYERYNVSFQARFSEKVEKLNRLLIYEKHRFEHFGLKNIWEKKIEDNFNLHIYRNDSLKYWSSNELPVLGFADIHFPDKGLLHLQNGWYYAQVLEIDNVVFCASFLIKKDYAYQNQDLENSFAPDFHLPFSANLSLSEEDFSIKGTDGEFLFSIVPSEKQEVGELGESVLLILMYGLVLLSFLLLFKWLRVFFPKAWIWLIPLVFVVYRFILFQSTPSNAFEKLTFFQPSLLALSEISPNFISFSLNAFFILAFLNWFWLVLKNAKQENPWLLHLAWVVFFSFYFFWNWIVGTIANFVENSSISLRVEKIFELDLYSILTYMILGAIFYCFYRLLLFSGKALSDNKKFLPKLYVLVFISGLLYFIYDLQWGMQSFICSIFPSVFLFLIIILQRQEREQRKEFGHGLLYLFVLVFTLTNLIAILNDANERSVRELYANQLQTDRDILTELEFEKVKRIVQDDSFLKKLGTYGAQMSNADFHDALERRYFGGFWEKYEMAFYFFNDKESSLLSGISTSKVDLDEVMKNHGIVSEVDSNVFFIADFTNQYSYLFRMTIKTEQNKSVFLYASFKSKRIPEEIGFPRLLISDQAKVLESLETYSIAKYYDKKLVASYGEYQFPTLISAFKLEKAKESGYLERGNFSHYFIKSAKDNYIFLSIKNRNWMDVLTSFSYLFCFFGILLLPLLFQNRNQIQQGYSFSLATKIQIVMIALVLTSLLIYGWGSGVFVKNQYNEYTNKLISEKLRSVSMEFQNKFGQRQDTMNNITGDIDAALFKYSKVFVTDINFYDCNGYLISSSRPKVYNVGLLSEQMNPKAMTAVTLRNESEFVHQEMIGNLGYTSAYQPFFNSRGKLQGYLNLQHFGQQKDFENQIQRFLMAIINVFVFLLAISAVVAIFVSGWLTEPLRLLQERFAKVNFGVLNESIRYDRQDEIGALVNEYNRKIDELAIAAQQLAQSERENAWREMAKQVAHEIKNPLTPMKLSLQHFQRIYDPENPFSKAKLDSVVASLIEQIDGLTKIANEFSNFAKMPNPNEEKIDLVVLVQGVIQIFLQDESIEISYDHPIEEVEIHVDKDMIVRILNNLLKNAIQAATGTCKIEVKIELKDTIVISIKDYGTGMTKDTMDRLFVPYFTTKSTGTGLGLAMVKQMVELHKGTIEVNSELNRFTIFTIYLPMA